MDHLEPAFINEEESNAPIVLHPYSMLFIAQSFLPVGYIALWTSSGKIA
jgi:hypothetical protein